jgi:hypothetical protein
MPRLNISRDTFARLKAFHPLGDQLQGEPLTMEQCAEALIVLGMRAILDGVWKPHDQDTLIETLQKLAEGCPQLVYLFLASVLATGGLIVQEQERQAPVLGFRAHSAPGQTIP